MRWSIWQCKKSFFIIVRIFSQAISTIIVTFYFLFLDFPKCSLLSKDCFHFERVRAVTIMPCLNANCPISQRIKHLKCLLRLWNKIFVLNMCLILSEKDLSKLIMYVAKHHFLLALTDVIWATMLSFSLVLLWISVDLRSSFWQPETINQLGHGD